MPKKPNQGPCAVRGCGRPIEVKTLCGKHYRMQRLYGRTELKNTGEKRRHPLYSLWFERKDRNSLCPAWADDFWVFVSAVGDRPSPSHLLRRLRPYEPYDPQNWEWHDALWREEGESRKTFYARKQASQIAKHPEFQRRRHLIRKFGITPERYDEMLQEQGGVCAICKNPERRHGKTPGTPMSLAVDHCHTDGHVRDLLCFRCNSVIGAIEESREMLGAIGAYLDRWQAKDHPGLTRPPPEFSKSREIMLVTPWGMLNASDAARKAGLRPETVLTRLRNGWPPDTVLQPLKRPRRLAKPNPFDLGDVV